MATFLEQLNFDKIVSTNYTSRNKDQSQRLRAVMVQGLERQRDLIKGKKGVEGRAAYRIEDDYAVLLLKYGNRPLIVGPNQMNAIRAANKDELLKHIDVLIQATKAGELDDDLKKAASLPRRKGKDADKPEAARRGRRPRAEAQPAA